MAQPFPVMVYDSEAAFNDAYCRRIQALREGRGWTQQQMATALDIPLERYKKYEIRVKSKSKRDITSLT